MSLFSRMNWGRLKSNDNISIPDYAPLFLFAGKKYQDCKFTDIQTCDIDKGHFVITYGRD